MWMFLEYGLLSLRQLNVVSTFRQTATGNTGLFSLLVHISDQILLVQRLK